MAVTIDGSTGVTYSDNIKHKYGTSGDLEIYHDGSNSYIKDTGTGNLVLGFGSASANELDDYEEGTFTATMSPGSGSIALNSSYNTGAYTKIGRLVHITAYLSISSVSSPSGYCRIAGLPFAVANLAEASESIRGCGQGFFNGGSPPDGEGYYPVLFDINQGETTVTLNHLNASGKSSKNNTTNELFANGADVFLLFSYFAA